MQKQIAKCYCQHCGTGVEFEASALTEENRNVFCPACGKPTTLSLPRSKPWRLVKRISAQKCVLLCGAVAFVLSGLFPPWLTTEPFSEHSHASAYRSFILRPPRDSNLDISRLAVEWLCIVAATGTIWLLMSKLEKNNNSKEN